MSKDFFDGRFNIKKIKYEKILKDFNIYKFGIVTDIIGCKILIG